MESKQLSGPARRKPDPGQEHHADRHDQAHENREPAILTRMGSGAPPARSPSADGLMILRQRDPERRGGPAGGFVVRAERREAGIEFADLVARATAVDVSLEHGRSGLG